MVCVWNFLNLLIYLAGTKEVIINRILRIVEVAYSNAGHIQQVQNYFKQKFFSSVAPIHKQYVTHFNNVDMGDKWIAQADEHHKVMDWHSKMEQTIRKIVIYNIWVFCVQHHYEQFIDFRQKMALQVLQNLHQYMHFYLFYNFAIKYFVIQPFATENFNEIKSAEEQKSKCGI